MSAATQVWGDVSVPLHTARLRHFADLGIGESLRRDGALAVVTGAVSNIENGIVSDRPDVDPAVAALAAHWRREALARGCEVGVLASTPDSQALYERLGFTLTRVRPRHWYYLP